MSKKTRHKQRMEAEQRAAQARKLERAMRAEMERLRSINASETFITQRTMRMAFEAQSLEEKECQFPFLSGRMFVTSSTRAK